MRTIHVDKLPAIGEADLQCYVDGVLDPERRALVEAYLAGYPHEARRLDVYRNQNIGFHALFDRYAEGPLPGEIAYLAQRIEARMRSGRMVRKVVRALAACMVVAAVGTGGWWLGRTHQAATDPFGAFTREAIDAHMRVASADDPMAHKLDSAGGEQLFAPLLRKVVGAPMRAPALRSLGFTLLGGRVLQADTGPAVQLLYRDDAGERVTFYMTSASGQGSTTGFNFLRRGKVLLFYWRKGPLLYSLIGEIGRSKLLNLAKAISREPDEATPADDSGTQAPSGNRVAKPGSAPGIIPAIEKTPGSIGSPASPGTTIKGGTSGPAAPGPTEKLSPVTPASGQQQSRLNPALFRARRPTREPPRPRRSASLRRTARSDRPSARISRSARRPSIRRSRRDS